MTHIYAKPRNIAKILSRTTFLSLARGEEPKTVFAELDTSALPSTVQTVSELFSFAFNLSRKFYRNEYIYKNAITNKIVFGRHSPRTSAVSIELPVGASIADIAIFNGTSTVYEIKTEFDTPRRLISQTPDYLRAFEKLYIVTHPKLAEKYAHTCHSHIGVACLNERESIQIIKPASSNLENIDKSIIFRMLRKHEFITAMEHVSGEPIDLANGLIRDYCHRLFTNLDVHEAHNIYVNALQKRTTSDESVIFLRSLPEHLRTLGYATPLSKIQKARLLKSLDLPIR